MRISLIESDLLDMQKSVRYFDFNEDVTASVQRTISISNSKNGKRNCEDVIAFVLEGASKFEEEDGVLVLTLSESEARELAKKIKYLAQ